MQPPTSRVAPHRRVGARPRTPSSSPIALLLQRWNDIAPWLIEALFADESYRRAFLAVAESGGSVEPRCELADPEARELLERAAVVDLDADAVSSRRAT